ncbi:MAG: hypothetical protein JWL89_410 [Candidatus Saccharibacteria bacterium]|nr:hypothetical protein [Candidatus Saccharibacteria bacterium]
MAFEMAPILGNETIDELRWLQLQANELPTLAERKEFAIRGASCLAVHSLTGGQWDVRSGELVSKSPDIDRLDWASIEKEIELLCGVKTITYVWGPAIRRDGLAVALKNIQPIIEDDGLDEVAEAEEDEVMKISNVYAPVLEIISWERA